MSTRIGDNFDYKGKNPNFERDQFTTLIEMVECDETFLDNGHISYCVATGRHYVFDGSNENDVVLGKWRPIPTQEAQNCSVINDSILLIGTETSSGNTVVPVKYFEAVDTEMNAYSDNPVRNSVITKYVRDVSNKVDNFDNRIINNTNNIDSIQNNIQNIQSLIEKNKTDITQINDSITNINQTLEDNNNNIDNINDEIDLLKNNKVSVVNNNISVIESGSSGESVINIDSVLSLNNHILFIDNRTESIPESGVLYITIKHEYIRNIFNSPDLFNQGIRMIDIMIQSNSALDTVKFLIESIDDTPQSLQNDGFNLVDVGGIEFIYNIDEITAGSETKIPRILKFELNCIEYEDIKRVIFRYIK